MTETKQLVVDCSITDTLTISKETSRGAETQMYLANLDKSILRTLIFEEGSNITPMTSFPDSVEVVVLNNTEMYLANLDTHFPNLRMLGIHNPTLTSLPKIPEGVVMLTLYSAISDIKDLPESLIKLVVRGKEPTAIHALPENTRILDIHECERTTLAATLTNVKVLHYRADTEIKSTQPLEYAHCHVPNRLVDGVVQICSRHLNVILYGSNPIEITGIAKVVTVEHRRGCRIPTLDMTRLREVITLNLPVKQTHLLLRSSAIKINIIK